MTETNDTTTAKKPAAKAEVEQQTSVSAVAALTTPCSLNAFREWLKQIEAISTKATLTTTTTTITAG